MISAVFRDLSNEELIETRSNLHSGLATIADLSIAGDYVSNETIDSLGWRQSLIGQIDAELRRRSQ